VILIDYLNGTAPALGDAPCENAHDFAIERAAELAVTTSPREVTKQLTAH
jgi:hypothetical protein